MNILVVVAHPDDEVLGFGGTAHKMALIGHKVTTCILAHRADARKNRPSYDELMRNIKKAHEILGIEEPILGDFPNIKFNAIPHIEIVEFIENAIIKTEAQIIFTHHPNDVNIDHCYTSLACQAAARLFQRRDTVPRLKGLYYMEILSSTDWAFPGRLNQFQPDTFNAGYNIIVYAKDGFQEKDIPENIKLYIGDIRNFSFLNIKEKIDYVIHMAGVIGLNKQSAPSKEEYEEINIYATAKLVNQCQKHNVQRLLFFSTINVYGTGCMKIIDENTMPNPSDLYSKTKLKAEKYVLNAKNIEGKLIGTVLRIATVYGPYMKGNYVDLIRAIARKRFIPIGKGMNRRTLIYIKDLAQAVMKTIENEISIGRIYNVTDGNIYTLKEIINEIYNALGKKAPKIALPENLVRYSLRFYEKIFNLFGKDPKLGEYLINKYTEDIAVSGERFIK